MWQVEGFILYTLDLKKDIEKKNEIMAKYYFFKKNMTKHLKN